MKPNDLVMQKARIIFFFLSLQFFLYNMGLVGLRLSLFGAVLFLLIFTALSLPPRGFRTSHILPAFGLLLTLAVIVRGSYEAVFVFPFYLATLLLLPKRPDHGEGEREALVIGVFIYSALALLQFYVPGMWHLFHSWGLVISRFSGLLIGQSYLLGRTPSGVPLFLMFLSYYFALALFAREEGFRYYIKMVVLLLIAQVVVLVLLTPLAILIQIKGPAFDVLLLNPEVFLFAGFCLTLRAKRPEMSTPEAGFKLLWAFAPGIIALVIAIVLALRPSPGEPGGKVLLYDQGYMNWRTPVYGKYGHKSGGMFGYLPKMLTAAGYEVETVDSLSRENISGADAIVVINVLDYFSEGEKDAVRQFVREGGGLLALGDHTGVQGIRGPFNDLLEPYRIEFLFDSASFLTKGWGEEAIAIPHPVTHGLYSPSEMDIWVGASLQIRPPARPVIVGRYGYSDIGDIAAVDHAYLGNRVYDPGEQLGDIVLVAANDYGRGRVLVFGDTSSFQNSAMVSSYRFVNRVFSWLTSGGSYGAMKTIILPLLLAVLALVVVLRRSAAIAGIISLAMVAGTLVGALPRRIEEHVDLDMATAVIESSHLERFDQLTWYDDCTGGLQYNLMRAGIYPLLMTRFSEEQIAGSEVAIIIAPVKSFSDGEAAVLERFMEQGGWILYTCGAEENDGSRSFLERQGLRLLDVPLTTFVDSLGTAAVNVYEGWGVEVSAPGAEIIAEKFGFPYIVRVPRGEGGIVLIADSHFLHCKNLEGMEEYYEGNIIFLKELFEDFLGKPETGRTNADGEAGT
jgi:hypothetical protein